MRVDPGKDVSRTILAEKLLLLLSVWYFWQTIYFSTSIFFKGLKCYHTKQLLLSNIRWTNLPSQLLIWFCPTLYLQVFDLYNLKRGKMKSNGCSMSTRMHLLLLLLLWNAMKHTCLIHTCLIHTFLLIRAVNTSMSGFANFSQILLNSCVALLRIFYHFSSPC